MHENTYVDLLMPAHTHTHTYTVSYTHTKLGDPERRTAQTQGSVEIHAVPVSLLLSHTLATGFEL